MVTNRTSKYKRFKISSCSRKDKTSKWALKKKIRIFKAKTSLESKMNKLRTKIQHLISNNTNSEKVKVKTGM